MFITKLYFNYAFQKVEMAPVLIPVEGNIKSSTGVRTSSGAVPATYGVTRSDGFSNPA